MSCTTNVLQIHISACRRCYDSCKNDNCNLCTFTQNCWHTLTNRASKNFAKAFSSSSVLRAVAVNHWLWFSNSVFVNNAILWEPFFPVCQVSFHKFPAITKAYFVSLPIWELQQIFVTTAHPQLGSMRKQNVSACTANVVMIKPQTGVAFHQPVCCISTKLKLQFSASKLHLGRYKACRKGGLRITSDHLATCENVQKCQYTIHFSPPSEKQPPLAGIVLSNATP